MDRKEVTILSAVAVFAAIIAFVLASILFTGAKKNNTAPVVDVVPSSMPDLKNDPAYNTIFNPNALDLAQPVQVGASQNNQPFNGSR